MKIYLDVCCLKRSFDDQTQTRIRLETDAIELIFHLVELEKLSWWSSEVVNHENRRNPNLARRLRVEILLQQCEGFIDMNSEITQRGIELEQLGFRSMDALHLASAEVARVDVFLTCDDRLLKRTKRHSKQLNIQVKNPIYFTMEMI